jgi:hypothetical protein
MRLTFWLLIGLLAEVLTGCKPVLSVPPVDTVDIAAEAPGSSAEGEAPESVAEAPTVPMPSATPDAAPRGWVPTPIRPSSLPFTRSIMTNDAR